MPIYHLLKERGFDPEHCEAMGVAFETALTQLGLKDRNDPMCEMVAKRIIEFGQQGVRDSGELVALTKQSIRGY
jgi:hypothetical protein